MIEWSTLDSSLAVDVSEVGSCVGGDDVVWSCEGTESIYW